MRLLETKPDGGRLFACIKDSNASPGGRERWRGGTMGGRGCPGPGHSARKKRWLHWGHAMAGCWWVPSCTGQGARGEGRDAQRTLGTAHHGGVGAADLDSPLPSGRSRVARTLGMGGERCEAGD